MLEGNARFDEFLDGLRSLLATSGGDEAAVLEKGRALMARLVAQDDWLPEDYAQADPATFKQYMLHREPDGAFTVLCVVWDRGQLAGAHDHSIWGIVGQLRGAERTREYDAPEPGKPMTVRHEEVLQPGQTCVISPSTGDIHDVSNAHDGVSISIHAYGGDLAAVAGKRSRYEAETGTRTPFRATYH